jgi:endogenous inhibitor of DNA gyrase (YacG/DUF329 family)
MSPKMPSRNDNRNDTTTPCPACGQQFVRSGRRQWCSDACRQAAWRRRNVVLAPPEIALVLPKRTKRDATVYECPNCETRYLGNQYCSDCRTFCRRVGRGGTCPHCDEPVAINDLIVATS